MKNTKVTLAPLAADDREQFILDNQWAFKYGAMLKFGERDNHLGAAGWLPAAPWTLGSFQTGCDQ